MWKKIGLSVEPFLSIDPLSTEEEFDYFVNRESEIKELSSYLSMDHAFNLLVTGKAGIGKTTLINKTLCSLPAFLRINLSQLEEHQAIIDRIILEIAKFAKTMDIREGKDIEKQLVYESRLIKSTAGKIEGGLPFIKAGLGKETREEKILRDALISRETLLENLLKKIMDKRGLPIIFLDDADHLPESFQAIILESCSSIFASKKCVSIFTSRKETGQLFASDADSVYRARFLDFLELKNIIKRESKAVRQILSPRLKKAGLDSFNYLFTEEIEAFLSDICDGNIRELLRYTAIMLRQAVLQNAAVPLRVEFAMAVLASKNYLISQIDQDIYTILTLLRDKPMSASDREFQKDSGLSRAALSNICSRLYESKFVDKTVDKNKVLYSTSAKGMRAITMYEMFRK